MQASRSWDKYLGNSWCNYTFPNIRFKIWIIVWDNIILTNIGVPMKWQAWIVILQSIDENNDNSKRCASVSYEAKCKFNIMSNQTQLKFNLESSYGCVISDVWDDITNVKINGSSYSLKKNISIKIPKWSKIWSRIYGLMRMQTINTHKI